MDADKEASVLIVDDQPANLVSLQAILKDMDLKIATATSGAQALKLMLKQDFAVLLLDINMPGMDGFETARLMRQRDKSKHIPIIFVTAMYTDEIHTARGYSVGAVDYIVKPYVPEVLRSKVAVFVDLFKKTEEVRRQSELMRKMEQRAHLTELTEQRRRLEADTIRMCEEHRIAHAIVEHAPLGIARVDSAFDVLEANEAFGRLFERDRELIVRTNVFESVPGLPAEDIVKAVRGGERFFAEGLKVEYRQREDGLDDPLSERHFDLAVWPIDGPDGDIRGAVLVALDVSERKRLSTQRDDFVATLAHDLQTPIIASDRALEVLEDSAGSNLSPEQVNLIAGLRDNNRTLLNMIQSLMDVYRYEAGAQPLYFDNVDLRLICETCITELQPLADKHGLEIHLDVAYDTRPVRADATAIRRVVTNLLDNAITYTPRGGTVKVSCFNEEGAVILQVSDTGVGIGSDSLSHVFDRYWHRAHARQHRSNRQSSGLGLYLCKQIIEAHGGVIACESEPGLGTTFEIQLAGQPASELSPAGSLAERSSGGR